MTEAYQTGDVNIRYINLKSLDGKRTFDLRNQITELNLYESAIQPLVHGDCCIVDAVGLYDGFPIIGEESIEISFTTASMKTITAKLNIYSVTDVQAESGNKVVKYNLNFVSQEAYKNATNILSQRYDGNISDIIPKIVSEGLSSKKNVRTEQTRGIDSHIVSNITPLQAIDKFRHRSVSTNNASSSFVFYEDLKSGFHFITLEEMLKNAKKPVAEYYFDDVVETDISQSKFRDIISLQKIQTQDTLSKLTAGSIRNVVQKFDLITGAVSTITYDSEKFEDVFVKTSKQARSPSADFVSKHTDPARTFLVPYDSSRNDNFIPEKVGILHAFVDRISQNIVHILIPGDTSLSIGDGIKIKAVTPNGTTKAESTESQYAISKIRHMLLISARPVYTQSLELIGNAYDL